MSLIVVNRRLALNLRRLGNPKQDSVPSPRNLSTYVSVDLFCEPGLGKWPAWVVASGPDPTGRFGIWSMPPMPPRGLSTTTYSPWHLTYIHPSAFSVETDMNLDHDLLMPSKNPTTVAGLLGI